MMRDCYVKWWGKFEEDTPFLMCLVKKTSHWLGKGCIHINMIMCKNGVCATQVATNGPQTVSDIS